MAKRAELHKNVKSTPLQDIKWSLSCTDACLKTVADTVKRLQLRMDSIEENMAVIKRNLTDEKLEKLERKKEKTEEDTHTFYWWHPNPAKRGFKNKDDCYLARE